MAKIYWRTIKRGTRKFEKCPEHLKAEIKRIAAKEVEDKIITAEQYKRYIGEDYVVAE